MAAPKVPKVKQCNDPDHPLFGCTAVEGRGTMGGQWGVFNPVTGGHWATADEVKDWKDLA